MNVLDGVGEMEGAPYVRVLLVDDHDDMLTMMRLMMARRSFDVETANSGNQALKLAPNFAPQVVVSDISMPDMSGYALMEHLRSMQGLRPFKSIALSGHGMDEDKDRARQSGFDAHFTKPVDFDELFAAMEELARQV